MLDKMVDIAGVLGFLLSVVLAIFQIISSRLRLSVGEIILKVIRRRLSILDGEET